MNLQGTATPRETWRETSKVKVRLTELWMANSVTTPKKIGKRQKCEKKRILEKKIDILMKKNGDSQANISYQLPFPIWYIVYPSHHVSYHLPSSFCLSVYPDNCARGHWRNQFHFVNLVPSDSPGYYVGWTQRSAETWFHHIHVKLLNQNPENKVFNDNLKILSYWSDRMREQAKSRDTDWHEYCSMIITATAANPHNMPINWVNWIKWFETISYPNVFFPDNYEKILIVRNRKKRSDLSVK